MHGFENGKWELSPIGNQFQPDRRNGYGIF